MRVLFITNLPSPYRVDFFNELGAHCELTVAYERRTAKDRDEKWQADNTFTFKEIYLDVKPVGTDKSIGLDAIRKIRETSFDFLILSGYSSPTIMFAIAYCKVCKIPYYLESDGGFNASDSFPKSILKKYLLISAAGYFVTCEEYKQYLKSLGCSESKVYKYPFTSLKQSEILSSFCTDDEKRELKNKLGIKENKIVLSVGRFIPGKGFDTLLKSVQGLSPDTGIYIVGGEPANEYTEIKETLKLDHVHFVGFRTKAELAEYYKIADLFILPTRKDVWGLVINEAMAHGIPVITTDKCIAGLELIDQGETGYIVPVDDVRELNIKMQKILSDDALRKTMQKACIEKIQPYTIENMAQTHLRFFKEILNKNS